MHRSIILKAAALGFLATSAALAAGEVQLVDASSRVNAFRGPEIQTLTADILVKNLAPGKRVGIRYRNHKGAWVDAWGTYQYTVGDGRERWSVSASPCSPYYESDCAMTDTELAAQMQAGGATYWDSNGEANYHLNRQSGYRLANGFKVFLLAPGRIEKGANPASGYTLVGRVLLENLGPSKSVKMVYTTDGWRTRAEQSLAFADQSGAYPPERFANPGEFGGEVWYYSFAPPEAQVLEFFIEYAVNGQTFHDSNFGRNYKLAYPEHPTLSVRGTPTAWQPFWMWPQTGIEGEYTWNATVDVSGHDPKERFKFDVAGDWAVNYGENDNGGLSRAGIAERSGGDIRFLDGAGQYNIAFENRSHAFRVEKRAPEGPVRRTLVFIHGRTVPGQNMYVRGGIDHAYSQNVLGKPCTREAAHDNPCAIPVRHRLRAGNLDYSGDWYLDWYGQEGSQTTAAAGSPLIWTTDNAGNAKTVAKDEVGYTPMNRYGEHYWMLDVEMDCSRTVNGWFEIKSFISGGPGWEGDIAQPGAPWASRNHFGKCGMINVFRRGENAATITAF